MPMWTSTKYCICWGAPASLGIHSQAWDLLSIVISCGVVIFVFCTEHVFVCGRHALSGNDCVTITGDRFKVFAVSSTVMICYEYYHYANTTIY